MLNVLQDTLEQENFIVSTATNAFSTEKLIKSEFFDLIVCDITMPEINGIEFIQILRNKGNRTLVIFLSGMIDGGMMSQISDLGLAISMHKPVRVSTLTTAIKNMIIFCEQISNIEKSLLELSKIGAITDESRDQFHRLLFDMPGQPGSDQNQA